MLFLVSSSSDARYIPSIVVKMKAYKVLIEIILLGNDI